MLVAQARLGGLTPRTRDREHRLRQVDGPMKANPWRHGRAKAAAGSVRWILPAAVAALLAIIWLAQGLDLDVAELMDFLTTSALFVLGIAVVAALAGMGLRFARRWLRR